MSVLAALSGALLLVAGCGGDDVDESTDPQEVLEKTFSSDADVTSGNLDISLTAEIEDQQSGNLDFALTGPFESRGEEELPLLGLQATASAKGGGQDFDFDGGLTVTEDAGFVSYDGTDYAVDDATFNFFKDAYAQSAAQQQEGGEEGAALLEQFGIDPSTWLTDVTNEGTEEIEGTETIHISGSADVAKILTDVQGLADQTGAQTIAPQDIEQLSQSVNEASLDVFTGAEDNILRRLDLTLDLTDPETDGSIKIVASIGINGVNEEQEFTVPEDTKPLDELIPGGLGALGGGLGGLGGVPEGGAGGGGAGGGGGGAGFEGGGATDAYLDCIAEAKGPEEVTACADEL